MWLGYRFSNHFFALPTHVDKGLHHWRWLRHAEIDEVANARIARRFDCNFYRNKIDLVKLFRLSQTGARNADQMHEGIRAAHLFRIRIDSQGMAGHVRSAARQFRFRCFSHKYFHLMSTFQ